jgi:hypothetical protein
MGLVGEEHERELAHHDIERGVGEGQVAGVALAPFDLRRDALRHREHARVEIEPHDMPLRPDAPRGLARHGAGSAAHVEHALTAADGGRVGQHHRRVGEDCGNEALLVDHRSIVGHLPGYAIGHRRSSLLSISRQGGGPPSPRA